MSGRGRFPFMQVDAFTDRALGDAIETVKVGGEAVTVVRGELDLEHAG